MGKNIKIYSMQDKEIDSIIESLKKTFIKISERISYNNPFTMSDIVSTNESNDDVKKLDILSNDYIIEELSKNLNIKVLASEENSDLIYTDNKDGKYFVTFDPLDGSSNIDSNITIGTIFGIFRAENIEECNLGDSIVSAGYCLYGGSTQLVYTKKDKIPVVNYYLLDNKKDFIKISELKIPKKGKTYAINESNKYIWFNNKKYKDLVDAFINTNYTLRWVGSLVADAHRTIIKGGFFSYPSDTKQCGKLRLLYEAIPFCFIIEQAGGKSYLDDDLSDWKNTKFPDNIHLKTPLILAGEEEDKLIKKIFNYRKLKPLIVPCLDFSDLDKKVENVPLAPRANSSRVGFINDSC